MFPLQLVVYPRERLPLHIFEERYRQLIHDCEEEGILFGVPTFLSGKMYWGCEVRLTEVVNRYPNGSMDVVCEGTRVFHIESFTENYPGKLYAGAEVRFTENLDDAPASLKVRVFGLVQKVFRLLGYDAPSYTDAFEAYTYAHKVGLPLEREYELLQLVYESDRLKLLENHLRTTIPIIRELNRTRALIAQNGHFKNFDPLDFKSFRIEE